MCLLVCSIHYLYGSNIDFTDIFSNLNLGLLGLFGFFLRNIFLSLFECFDTLKLSQAEITLAKNLKLYYSHKPHVNSMDINSGGPSNSGSGKGEGSGKPTPGLPETTSEWIKAYGVEPNDQETLLASGKILENTTNEVKTAKSEGRKVDPVVVKKHDEAKPIFKGIVDKYDKFQPSSETQKPNMFKRFVSKLKFWNRKK